ncbi:PaaI family thioesterase [uncultured Enterovirga sp.]|uniref:PaaI family thioesterase n=1 Tax=uncultured Enterovirga sp. TaxID=2026352 RepID=UPI0035C99137
MGGEVGIVARDVVLRESGLALLQGLIDGRHPKPPFADTTGCILTEVADGRAVFTGRPDARFLNPLGAVHGGWTSGILDSAMACAVHSCLKAGQAYTTLELKVHLVRAILPGSGELTCEGRIVHRGGTVATSEGYLRDAEGRLLAHGTETCLIFDAAARPPRG